jgi:hypothetical protein
VVPPAEVISIDAITAREKEATAMLPAAWAAAGYQSVEQLLRSKSLSVRYPKSLSVRYPKSHSVRYLLMRRQNSA